MTKQLPVLRDQNTISVVDVKLLMLVFIFMQNRFATQPEIYKQFLEILQTYQREAKPIQDVYAQVTQLFNTAPDLLEDFKQFLPESAAQAKAQAIAARQAAEDAAVTSSVRGEPYPSGNQINQAQTPRSDVKVPPIGNFAPPSAAKESKKHHRRTAAAIGGQPSASGSTQLPAPPLDSANQSNRAIGTQLGGVSKVSQNFSRPFRCCFHFLSSNNTGCYNNNHFCIFTQ